MNCYIVEINGEPFVVAAFTADDAERVALMQFTGVVFSVVIRVAEDEVIAGYEASLGGAQTQSAVTTPSA